jgi:hypothetical protein
MATSSSDPSPLKAWMQVLDRIEQALAESLTLSAELPPTTPGSEGTTETHLAMALQDESLSHLQTSLGRAAQIATAADVALMAEAGTLEAWLAQVGPIRERLASLVAWEN